MGTIQTTVGSVQIAVLRLHGHCTIPTCKPAGGTYYWLHCTHGIRGGTSLAAEAAMRALFIQYLTALLVVAAQVHATLPYPGGGCLPFEKRDATRDW